MTNFGAKILNNAVSGMRAQQAVIATTGNNIANVNTPGYSRRVVDLSTRASGSNSGFIEVGNGVQIEGVRRINDIFLERILRGAGNEKSSYNVQTEFMNRLEPLFDLTGTLTTVGSSLTKFFNSAQDLALDPASIELRANFISELNNLTSTIRSTFESVASLQAEADLRIETELQTVNSLVEQVAQLNQSIIQYEASGQSLNNDDRDRRDLILGQLSEKITFTTVEMPNGGTNVYLENGFNLVNGSISRSLETTKAPSFALGPLPPSLNGGILNHIVYDYSPGGGGEHFDLTQVLKNGGGSIGGLLKLRGYNDPSNGSSFNADGALVAVASRIEGITRQLLTTINLEYLGPDRDGGTAGHQPSSGGLDGSQPGVYGLFDFDFAGVKDVNTNGVPDDLVLTGIDNYSSILMAGVSDPLAVAAARDIGAGPPAAPVFAPGDASNMEALSGLRSSSFTFGVGSYSLTGTFDTAYSETVTFVSNTVSTLRINAAGAEDRYTAAASRRDEISAVSLDEEFTKLIQTQKAFQASARMVRIASEMLDEVVRLI